MIYNKVLKRKRKNKKNKKCWTKRIRNKTWKWDSYIEVFANAEILTLNLMDIAKIV